MIKYREQAVKVEVAEIPVVTFDSVEMVAEPVWLEVEGVAGKSIDNKRQ